jgi:hypothetical protein
MLTKIVSGALGLIYVVAAYLGGGPIASVQVATALVFPLACVWYSEELGSISSGMMGRSYVTSETPGCFVAFFGWVVLLLPCIVLMVHIYGWLFNVPLN